LVELLVVLVILSLVMMAIYSIYFTHERTALTQDELVDVQQNIRIGMDSITRDIRMAGFLVPSSSINPVNTAYSGNGILQPLPAPDNINSDAITISTASASATVAEIKTPAGAKFFVYDALSVATFTVGDVVTIIRPSNKTQPAGVGNFTINSKNSADPSLTLSATPGGVLIEGDLIVKIGSAGAGVYPNTITYCLGPSVSPITLPSGNRCGNNVTTCPAGELCLMRIVNIGQPGEDDEAIAQNIAGLQISYLMDDGTETDSPTSLNTIRSVRVTLIGQTATTVKLSNNVPRQRRLESVIMMRNR